MTISETDPLLLVNVSSTSPRKTKPSGTEGVELINIKRKVDVHALIEHEPAYTDMLATCTVNGFYIYIYIDMQRQLSGDLHTGRNKTSIAASSTAWKRSSVLA